MMQQRFHFARRDTRNGDPWRQADGKGFQAHNDGRKPVQVLNPKDLSSPATTLVLRLTTHCQELGLSCGDLVLVNQLSTDQHKPDEFWAVSCKNGGIALARASDIVSDRAAEVIGKMVLALPGAKGLRYIANLYPIGRRGINRQAAD
jgi:hypothetical protein